MTPDPAPAAGWVSSAPGTALFVLAAAAMLAACTPRVALPPAPFTEPGIADLARLTGTLQGDASTRCVWLADLLGRHTVLWPPGYTASFDPTVVYDPQGRVVASEGESVTGAGAVTGLGGLPVSRCRAGKDVWILNLVTPHADGGSPDVPGD